MGGLAGGLSEDPALQVVELARQLRSRRRARQEVGRGVGRRRSRVSQQERRGPDVTGIDTVNAPQTARVGGSETNAVVSAVSNGLYLAAMPTFAVMAVLTSMNGGSADVMCAAAHGGWLSGM